MHCEKLVHTVKEVYSGTLKSANNTGCYLHLRIGYHSV